MLNQLDPLAKGILAVVVGFAIVVVAVIVMNLSSGLFNDALEIARGDYSSVQE